MKSGGFAARIVSRRHLSAPRHPGLAQSFGMFLRRQCSIRFPHTFAALFRGTPRLPLTVFFTSCFGRLRGVCLARRLAALLWRATRLPFAAIPGILFRRSVCKLDALRPIKSNPPTFGVFPCITTPGLNHLYSRTQTNCDKRGNPAVSRRSCALNLRLSDVCAQSVSWDLSGLSHVSDRIGARAPKHINNPIHLSSFSRGNPMFNMVWST